MAAIVLDLAADFPVSVGAVPLGPGVCGSAVAVGVGKTVAPSRPRHLPIGLRAAGAIGRCAQPSQTSVHLIQVIAILTGLLFNTPVNIPVNILAEAPMMTENRRQILDMLSQGKITVDEAERLMTVVDQPAGAETGRSDSSESHSWTR